MQFPLGNLAGSAFEVAERRQGPASGQSDTGGIEMDRVLFGKQICFGFFVVAAATATITSSVAFRHGDDDDVGDDMIAETMI